MIVTRKHITPWGPCNGTGSVPLNLVPEPYFTITGTCSYCKQWVACESTRAASPSSYPRRRPS